MQQILAADLALSDLPFLWEQSVYRAGSEGLGRPCVYNTPSQGYSVDEEITTLTPDQF